MATKTQISDAWKPKTGVEAQAIEDAFWRSDKQTSEGVREDMHKASRAARDEVRRETRGRAPAAYAKGGAIKGWGKARGARAAKVQ